MTRSVEIPEEAAEAVAGHFYTMHSKIAWSQIDPHSSVALNYKRWARGALEAAALPYLAPAADAPVADRERVAEVLHKSDWRFNHGWKESGRCGEAHREQFYAQADALFDAGLLVGPCCAASAGDGGLREALEPLIAASESHGARIDFQLARFRTMLAQQEADLPLAAHPAAPAVPQPACQGDGVCTNPRCPTHGIEWDAVPQPAQKAFDVGYNIVNQLADLWEVPVDVRQATNDRCWEFAAELVASAVPQPVDREALMLALTKWDVGGWKYDDAEGYRERVCNSLLAVLAGEQEQVEK